MKTNVTFSQFTKAFHDHGRENNFSYEGLQTLYDYLIELEEDTGEEIELDVIALCCDYSEGSYEEIVDCYNLEIEPDPSECSITDDDEVRKELTGAVVPFLNKSYMDLLILVEEGFIGINHADDDELLSLAEDHGILSDLIQAGSVEIEEEFIKGAVRKYLEHHSRIVGEVDGGFVYAIF